VATELADQLLPSITTVEVRESELGGPNLIAWRPSLDLNSAEAHLPATLVVLNPGDEEKPQAKPLKGASPRKARRMPSSAFLSPPPIVALPSSRLRTCLTHKPAVRSSACIHATPQPSGALFTSGVALGREWQQQALTYRALVQIWAAVYFGLGSGSGLGLGLAIRPCVRPTQES